MKTGILVVLVGLGAAGLTTVTRWSQAGSDVVSDAPRINPKEEGRGDDAGRPRDPDVIKKERGGSNDGPKKGHTTGALPKSPDAVKGEKGRGGENVGGGRPRDLDVIKKEGGNGSDGPKKGHTAASPHSDPELVTKEEKRKDVGGGRPRDLDVIKKDRGGDRKSGKMGVGGKLDDVKTEGGGREG